MLNAFHAHGHPGISLNAPLHHQQSETTMQLRKVLSSPVDPSLKTTGIAAKKRAARNGRSKKEARKRAVRTRIENTDPGVTLSSYATPEL